MPRTRERYETALEDLVSWWRSRSSFPTSLTSLDSSVAEYIESLWAEGAAGGVTADTLSSLSYTFPFVRGHLRESWRLLKTWRRLYPPGRCAPMSPDICLGLAGAAVEAGAIDVGALLLTGFDGIMRTQSLLLLRVGHISFLKDKAIIRLIRTKTTMRTGGLELVVIQSRLAARVLRLACEGRGEAELVLNRSPAKFRLLFKTLVETLHLDHANLQPCSLRRGGASHDFLRHGSMERTLLRGHLGIDSSCTGLCAGRGGGNHKP